MPFSLVAETLTTTGKAILAKRQLIEKSKQQIQLNTTQYQNEYSTILKQQFDAVADVNKQIAALVAEKERTREELEQGLFCSQCKRSKSKIERETKQSFASHLTSVKGVAEPMPLTEIMKQMADYDKKIRQLEKRRDAIELRYNERLTKLTDRHEEAIIDIEIILEKAKSSLQQLEAAFRVSHQDYLDTTFTNDQAWLSGQFSHIEHARVAMISAQRAQKLTLDSQNKQLENLINLGASMAQVQAIKNSIAQTINQFKTTQQTNATRYNALVAKFESEKINRLKKKQQSEANINRIINEVGLVDTLDTAQNLASNTRYNTLNTHNYFSKLDNIFNRFNNATANKVAKYQSEQNLQAAVIERLNAFKNAQQSRISSLFEQANQLVKRIDGTSSEFGNYLDHTSRKGVFSRWRKNIGRDLEKELMASGVDEFVKNDLKPNGVWLARFINENKIKTGLQNIGLLMARRGVHNYADSEFRRKYPNPDEYYEKAWALRNIDPDIGIASWFDFTNTQDNEGVKGYLNEVFAPFHKMVDEIQWC